MPIKKIAPMIRPSAGVIGGVEGAGSHTDPAASRPSPLGAGAALTRPVRRGKSLAWT